MSVPHADWRQRKWSCSSYRQETGSTTEGSDRQCDWSHELDTDFVVDQSSKRFKLFFTADLTEGTPGAYPIEAYLKFTDGSNLQVVNQSMKPPTGTGAQFGPFSPPADKAVSQVNFKIGANKDPGGTGFSYRISVQGCN